MNVHDIARVALDACEAHGVDPDRLAVVIPIAARDRRFPSHGFEPMTREQLQELPEYSCPTGATVGKRWRRNVNAYAKGPRQPEEWWVGEFVDAGNGRVSVRWSRVVLVGGEVDGISDQVGARRDQMGRADTKTEDK